MSESREGSDVGDDEAPTLAWKRALRRPSEPVSEEEEESEPARVVVHPKFDPRKLPTERARRPAFMPSLLQAGRRGIGVAWVVAFVVVAYVAFLAAVFLSMR